MAEPIDVDVEHHAAEAVRQAAAKTRGGSNSFTAAGIWREAIEVEMRALLEKKGAGKP